MSILIKGVDMPKDCLTCQFHGFGGYKSELIVCSLTGRSEGQLSKVSACPLVEVPTPHGPLIDVRALYERTAEWEAQALARVEKLDPRVENQRQGWVHWSVVLEERSAFKHDLMDAPTIIEAEEDSHE